MELKIQELESLLANYIEKDKKRIEIQSDSISIALREQREAFYQENAKQKEFLLDQQVRLFYTHYTHYTTPLPHNTHIRQDLHLKPPWTYNSYTDTEDGTVGTT